MIDKKTQQTVEKLIISRSSRFPSITLDYAINVVTEASKFGKNITNSHVAGSGATKGGAFARKKASLGYYRLIEGKSGGLQITSLAEKIINPLNGQEKTQAIQEAFLSPELFKKLYNSTQKGAAINLSFLGNLLIREYSIQPSAKNEFLSTFIKSGIYANLLKYSDQSKTEIIFLEPAEKEKVTEDKNPFFPFSFYEKADKQNEVQEIQTVDLVLANGRAKIIVPKELTQPDVKKLKAQIDILANIFND